LIWPRQISGAEYKGNQRARCRKGVKWNPTLASLFRGLMVGIRAGTAISLFLLAFASCALSQRAPGLPSQPWHSAEEQRFEVDARNFHDSRFNIDPTRTYSLTELIDLAEAHNPEPGLQWARARAQAAALGVARGELYPTLAA